MNILNCFRKSPIYFSRKSFHKRFFQIVFQGCFYKIFCELLRIFFHANVPQFLLLQFLRNYTTTDRAFSKNSLREFLENPPEIAEGIAHIFFPEIASSKKSSEILPEDHLNIFQRIPKAFLRDSFIGYSKDSVENPFSV